MVGFMTIVVSGEERVEVVFPATLRIGDVIVFVYLAAWDWVVERYGEFGRYWRDNERSSSGSS
jgi:hypothetical protein